MQADDVKKIAIISEGTGETAQRLLHAILAHYADANVQYSIEAIYRHILSKEQLSAVLSEIPNGCFVIFSLITDELRNYLPNILESRSLRFLNILEPMRQSMQDFLEFQPRYEPGILQKSYDRYYKKMDAIGYTVRHDDGMGGRLEEAEVILVGPSRSCKTPISMYLATHYGLKVANIPLVPDETMRDRLLNRLKRLDQSLIFGIVIKPSVLASIRGTRTKLISGQSMVDQALDGYQGFEDIQKELLFCRRLYSSQGWEVIDVTERAIEEISSGIVNELVIATGRSVEDDAEQ